MSILHLYHGSADIIEVPKFGYGNIHNDYGLAFYTTKNIELAKEWSVDENRNGFVNHYSLDTDGLTMLDFNSGDYSILNWLAILIENRTFRINTDAINARAYLLDNFLLDYKSFDVIKGYRADDSYFSFANAFLNNNISLDKLVNVMRLGELGEQYAIKSNKAFDRIRFIDNEFVDYEVYYAKKKSRDDNARMQYKKENQNMGDGIYLIDIIRQKWRNGDERIQRIIY